MVALSLLDEQGDEFGALIIDYCVKATERIHNPRREGRPWGRLGISAVHYRSTLHRQRWIDIWATKLLDVTEADFSQKSLERGPREEH